MESTPTKMEAKGRSAREMPLLTPRKRSLDTCRLKAGTNDEDRFERLMRQLLVRQHSLVTPYVRERDALLPPWKRYLFSRNGS
jgi:hypothetical protein